MITSENFHLLDFWFYTVGVNVCPADTRNKKVSESWKPMQNSAMSSEEFEDLKKTGAFIRGAAVVTGKVWRGNYVGYYLNGIDLDNGKAIKEICYANIFEKAGILQELAQSTLLEQHKDVPTKLHIYVYSKHPFKNKSSDIGRAWFNKETMPAIEVKGPKCLMFCTPSINKGGHRYEFLNQRVPGLTENLEQVINDILLKHDIDYLSKADLRSRGIQEKTDAAKTANEGSRHVELLREMNARLHEFIRTKSLEEIRQLCIKFNNLYCRPHLPLFSFIQFYFQINDSSRMIIQKNRRFGQENEPNQKVRCIMYTGLYRKIFYPLIKLKLIYALKLE